MKTPSRPRTQAAVEVDVYPPGTLSLAAVDLSARADEATYDDELERLQESAFALQIRNFLERRRAVLVFEGWDAAGKGGAIRRLTSRMDPRGYGVWPIGPPREEDLRNHWLERFWRRLPDRGELAIFDRSWYGRVLAERVEKLARPEEWRRAYGEINAFERTLTADGVRMVKFFLHVDRRTQRERFEARERDPLKRYKLTPSDWRNYEQRSKYERAIGDLLDRTHRPDAPWVLVAANDKKHARLEVLRRTIRLLEGEAP